jgi:CBS domain-containing protein
MAPTDPVGYLRGTPPFHALSEELFQATARSLEIAFYPAGSRLVHKGGTPLEHLYVIRKGSVRLERDGQTLQVLEEGEIFGYTSLITNQASMDVVVDEDLLAYRLPRAQFEALLADARFAGHFAVGLSERLKASLEHSQVATFQADLSAPVSQLVRRRVVRVPAEATVGQAARLMRDLKVSSVVVQTDPEGIVTDRDFRNRVLAEGLGPDVPVIQVFTQGLKTVPADAPIYEAWAMLIESGVHHLPVMKGGEMVGMVTANDLLKASAQGPVAVLRRVERLAGRDQLPGYGARVAEMASALLAGGLDATVIAGFVARLNDALMHRILTWGEAELGRPPCPYAWIVSGSEGRMEQTLLTDQDNALIHAADGAEAEDYFRRLAERANDDLEAAGFPRCPGGYMAREWRAPIDEWVERFNGWVADRGPQTLMRAAIFVDQRKVYGQLDLAPFAQAVKRAGKDRLFLLSLAKAALDARPPASLLLRLKGESSQVNIKAQGLTPIVYLARCYGLEVGAEGSNTLARLDAAVQAGLMGEHARALVGEAFRFLLGLRLRLQLRAVAEGRPLANTVHLADLTSIERSRLKESFKAIRDWQDLAAYRYRTDLF